MDPRGWRQLAALACALALVMLAASACAAKPVGPTGGTAQKSGASGEPTVSGSPTEGVSPAPGLYDQADGTVLAVGILSYVELEGGFWALTEPAGAGSDMRGATIAVLANGDYFMRRLEPLKGRLVSVSGTRLHGASIRMAGPEIEIKQVGEVAETP